MNVSKHLRKVKIKLYMNLVKAYRGWFLWHRIVKKYHIGNTAVILMPSNNRDDNFYALLYIDQMLMTRRFDNALILSHDSVVKSCASLFSKNIIAVHSFSRKKAEALMQYYCLYEFDNRLIIASLDEPNGRNGSKLIGKRGTTAEEVFVIGVYRVYPFLRPGVPEYKGEDQNIKKFLYD